MRDELGKLRLSIGYLSDEGAIDLILQVSLPILIIVIGVGVELGHF